MREFFLSTGAGVFVIQTLYGAVRKSNLVMMAFDKDLTAELSRDDMRATVMRWFQAGNDARRTFQVVLNHFSK